MTPQDLSTIGAGFTDLARGSQAVFRAALEALSHPGRPVDVPHDAEQVGPRRRARQAEVPLPEPLELPQQRLARVLEVGLQGCLRVAQVGHGSDHAARRALRSPDIRGPPCL